MAELLKEHKNTIFKIHEHDSLLENTEEEDLDEEERKAAWEAYENEKNYNGKLFFLFFLGPEFFLNSCFITN